MGVDVGARALHYVIRRSSGQHYFLLRAGVARGFEELAQLITAFDVQHCTLDAQPETHAARRLMQLLPGRVSLCYYTASPGEDRVQNSVWHVDRTAILDATVERFRLGVNRLPPDAVQLGGGVRGGRGEYFRQLMGEPRLFEKSAAGELIARYRGGASCQVNQSYVRASRHPKRCAGARSARQ